MRKVTELSVDAFINRKSFSSGNTLVRANERYTEFVLHGNVIAIMDEDKTLKVTNCGYTSNVSKERLNGILQHFNARIYQKKFQWYIETNEDIKEFPSDEWVEIWI
jgi:hypothetical protein